MTLPRISPVAFQVVLAATLVVTTREEFLIIDNLNDRTNHILAFFVLAFLVDYSTPKVRSNWTKALAVLGYGFLIEAVQYFLPYRDFSLLDLAADGIGLAAYALSQPALGWFYYLRRP